MEISSRLSPEYSVLIIYLCSQMLVPHILGTVNDLETEALPSRQSQIKKTSDADKPDNHYGFSRLVLYLVVKCPGSRAQEG